MRAVSLLADLLETILQDNKEILLELKVGNVISAFKRDNPTISGLTVNGDLNVEASTVPQEHGAAMALGALIFRIKEYIEVFQGKADADRRMGISTESFRKRVGEEAVAELSALFPDLFRQGGANGTDIGGLDDLGKAKMMFMDIFSKALAKGVSMAAIVAGLRAAPSVRDVADDLSVLEFKPSVWVGEAVSDMSLVVERTGIKPDLVSEILAEYGGMPEEIGLMACLYGGALAKSIRFGCGPIDSLLRDGIGRDDSMVLEGPAGVEKDILSKLFIARVLGIGGCAVVVSTVCSVDCVRRGLRVAGVDVERAEAESRLIFVDWHSRHVERVTSIDDEGAVIRVSNDLTNLAVGIDMALKRAAGRTQLRLVMDLASPTVVTEGFDRVHDFLNSVRAKMKNASCAGLILLNQEIHPPDQLGMLEDIFDGAMAIERTVEMGRITSTFRVSAMTGRAFSKSRLTLSATDRGLVISGGEGSAGDETVKFDHGGAKGTLGLPGIEALSQGGLPKGGSFLVWMPSTVMPVDFVKPVVMEAQREGHGTLLALSSIESEGIGLWMSEAGMSSKGLIDRGSLQIVDWFGQRSGKVLGMEVDEGVIRTSKDLTHLGVGIDMALRRMSGQESLLAVTEFVSQALRLFDLKSVYAFAQSLNAKLASHNFTSFVIMERGTHDRATNAALEELFDGIIDIRASPKGPELCLLTIRGCHFQPEYRSLNKVRDRLTVDVSRSVSSEEVTDAIAQEGLARKLRELEQQLGEVLAEKAQLEKRVGELTEREAEYDRRHTDMEATLAQVEEKLATAPVGIPIDEEHRKELTEFLEIMDRMLDNLPPEVIDTFARSEDFKLYEKVLKIYLGDTK